jgi:hypothetical protein
MPFRLLSRFALRSEHMRPVTLGALALVLPLTASATLTVAPAAPYEITSAGVVNFAGSKDLGTPLSGGFVDEGAGFKYIDLNSTALGQNDNILLFDVQSNKNFGSLLSGQDVVLMVTATVSGQQVPIPIGYAFGSYCATGGNDRCQALSGSKYYAVRYSITGGNETLRVGIFPKDICASPLTAGTIPGCTSNEVDEPSGGALGSLTSLGLRFYLSIENPDAQLAGLGRIADTEENRAITVQFQQGVPSITSCPDDLSAFYSPGDGEISFDGSAVSSSYFTNSGSPIDTVIFLATEGTPTTNEFYDDTSQIIDRVSAVRSEVVRGFTNTTNGTDHVYNVAIGVRDRAGVVADGFIVEGGTTPSCSGSGTDYQVQTASIRGLMVESKCFIATAAFGSGRAAPVLLLRRLRDEWLSQSRAGRWVIEGYYQASPAIAEWLLRNPAWRWPVLSVLIGVQLWAWLILNPLWLVLLLGTVITLFVSSRLQNKAPILLLATLLLPVAAQGEELAPPMAEPSLIEEVQERQREEETRKGSSGSWIESKQKELAKPAGDYSLIEEVRARDEEQRPSQEGGPTYLDEKRRQLPPGSSTSAIEEFRKGKSEAEARKDTKVGNAFGFKIWTGGDRSVTASSGTFYGSYDSVYGTDYTPDFRFFYENQLFQSEWLLSLGWFAETGFGWKKADGTFQFPPQQPGGGTYGVNSDIEFIFVTVPVAVGAVARFNLLRLFRPQIKAAPVAVGYFEDRSDAKGIKRGYSTGILTELGLAFQIDWLDSRSSWSLYEMFQVKQHFLTLDYQRIDAARGDVDIAFQGLTLGLLFEI